MNKPATPRPDVSGRPAEIGALELGAPPRATRANVLAGTLQLLVAGAILVAAWLAYEALMASSPVAERGSRERVARLVEVDLVKAATQGPEIQAWGDVRAARTLIVRPEIAGRIEWVHPEVTPGGRLSAGQVVARLDPRDLELAVLQAKSDIAEIEARMVLEEGQAAIGIRELTRLSRNLSDSQRSLVLREPQRAQLEAELAAARAVLEQAELALSRTTVRAPFDALVLEEQVAAGAMLMQGSDAATLVASDRFHVVLPVPASALSWIDVAGNQEVILTQPGVWADGQSRVGRVLRLGGTMSQTGRMAELVVEVQNPLDAGSQPPLLLGSFVSATIIGKPLVGAVAIDRAYLRDGDTVWVMTPDDSLQVRDVVIAWRGPNKVLIQDGLDQGERLVTTRLATFVDGMALRVEDAGK